MTTTELTAIEDVAGRCERGEKLNKMDLLRIAGWLWRLLDLELRLAGKWKRANGRAG